MTQREQFVQWLEDAHAMEVGIVSTLQKHIADAKGKPAVRAALARHLQETKRHAVEMKKALAAMGGSHPVLKEGISKLANLAAGLVTTVAKDTMVKNAIAGFATEHFEIACYNSLIVAATALGEGRIATTCRRILREEKAMARALEGQLKGVTESHLTTLEDEKSERPDEEATPARRRSVSSARGKAKSGARSAKSARRK